TSSRRCGLNKSTPNIASECRIANIVRDHAMILSDDATLGRMRFSERTRQSRPSLFIGIADAVAQGFVHSLTRPEGKGNFCHAGHDVDRVGSPAQEELPQRNSIATF